MAGEENWSAECEHSLVCSMDAVVKWWGDHHGLLVTAKIYQVFQVLHGHCDPGIDVIGNKVRIMRDECSAVRRMLRHGFRFDSATKQVVGSPEVLAYWERKYSDALDVRGKAFPYYWKLNAICSYVDHEAWWN